MIDRYSNRIKVTSGVIILYYPLWILLEYLLGAHFNPPIQSFESIGLFFILVTGCHMLTHYSPCLLVGQPRDLKRLLRINKVTARQVLLSFMIFAAYNIIAVYLITAQDALLFRYFDISFEMNDYIAAQSIPVMFVMILVIGLLIPIGEELFYRGFLLRGMEGISKTFAILASAFYFAIYHNNPHRLITLFLFGLIFGLVVKYTNSIIPGTIMHIITNTSFVVFGYLQSGNTAPAQYGDLLSRYKLLENELFLLASFVFSVIICVFSIIKLKKIALESSCEAHESAFKEKSDLWFILPAYGISILVFLIKVF